MFAHRSLLSRALVTTNGQNSSRSGLFILSNKLNLRASYFFPVRYFAKDSDEDERPSGKGKFAFQKKKNDSDEDERPSGKGKFSFQKKKFGNGKFGKSSFSNKKFKQVAPDVMEEVVDDEDENLEGFDDTVDKDELEKAEAEADHYEEEVGLPEDEDLYGEEEDERVRDLVGDKEEKDDDFEKPTRKLTKAERMKKNKRPDKSRLREKQKLKQKKEDIVEDEDPIEMIRDEPIVAPRAGKEEDDEETNPYGFDEDDDKKWDALPRDDEINKVEAEYLMADDSDKLEAVKESLERVKRMEEQNALLGDDVVEIENPEGSQPLSTSVRLTKFPDIYTPISRVSEHNNEDVGRYFLVDEKTRAAIPEFLVRKNLKAEFDHCHNWMRVAPQAYYLKNLLQKKDDKSQPIENQISGKTIAVLGRKGTGKSATLFYAAQYAKENGWLTLSTWGEEFTRDRISIIKAHPTLERIYDQPELTATVFERLAKFEKDPLEKIKLKTVSQDKYDWTLNEAKKEGDAVTGASLYDLVVLGSRNPALAPRLLDDFVKEVQQATEVPVITIIDDYTAWDMQSEFRDPVKEGRKALLGRNLALVNAFDTLLKDPPANGVGLWAFSGQGNFMNRKVPHHKKWSYRVCTMKPLDDIALWKTIVHYSISQTIQIPPEEINREYIAMAKGLSGSIPFELLYFAATR